MRVLGIKVVLGVDLGLGLGVLGFSVSGSGFRAYGMGVSDFDDAPDELAVLDADATASP